MPAALAPLLLVGLSGSVLAGAPAGVPGIEPPAHGPRVNQTIVYCDAAAEQPVATLINDPLGDDVTPVGTPKVDVGVIEAGSSPSAVTFRVNYSADTDMTKAAGYGYLDTDRNPATGLVPSLFFGKVTQDIGMDYLLDLWWVPTYHEVDVYKANAPNDFTYICTVPAATAVAAPNWAKFSVPTSAIGGDDGAMDVDFAVGEDMGGGTGYVTDWAPDVGHGTILPVLPPVDVGSVSCTPALFNPGAGGSLACGFSLNRPAWAALLVLNIFGSISYVSPVGDPLPQGANSIPWIGQLAAGLADGYYVPVVYGADADGHSDYGLTPGTYVAADNGVNPVISNLTVAVATPPAGGLAGSYNVAFDVDKYQASSLLAVLNDSGAFVRLLIHPAAYAGHQAFLWDGKDGGGNSVPAGTYWFVGAASDMFGRGAGCYTNTDLAPVGCFNYAAAAPGRPGARAAPEDMEIPGLAARDRIAANGR